MACYVYKMLTCTDDDDEENEMNVIDRGPLNT